MNKTEETIFELIKLIDKNKPIPDLLLKKAKSLRISIDYLRKMDDEDNPMLAVQYEDEEIEEDALPQRETLNRYNIMMHPSMMAALKVKSKKQNISVSQLLRDYIQEQL